jgi:hypothetical protein
MLELKRDDESERVHSRKDDQPMKEMGFSAFEKPHLTLSQVEDTKGLSKDKKMTAEYRSMEEVNPASLRLDKSPNTSTIDHLKFEEDLKKSLAMSRQMTRPSNQDLRINPAATFALQSRVKIKGCCGTTVKSVDYEARVQYSH